MRLLAPKSVHSMAAKMTVRQMDLQHIDLTEISRICERYEALRENVKNKITHAQLEKDSPDDCFLYPAGYFEDCVRECSHAYRVDIDDDWWDNHVREAVERIPVYKTLQEAENILKKVDKIMTSDVLPKLILNMGAFLVGRQEPRVAGQRASRAVYTVSKHNQLCGTIKKMGELIKKITNLKDECLHQVLLNSEDAYYQRLREMGDDIEVDYMTIFDIFYAKFDKSEFWRGLQPGGSDPLCFKQVLNLLQTLERE